MILRTTCALWLVMGGAALAETPESSAGGYTADTPVEKLAADPAAVAVLNKDLPGLLSDAAYPLFKSMSLKQLQSASGGDLSEVDMDKCVADLQAMQQQQHASLPPPAPTDAPVQAGVQAPLQAPAAQ